MDSSRGDQRRNYFLSDGCGQLRWSGVNNRRAGFIDRRSLGSGSLSGWGWSWGSSIDADLLETASLLQTWDHTSCEQTAETSLLDSERSQLELGWLVAIAFFLVFNQLDILFFLFNDAEYELGLPMVGTRDIHLGL